MDLADFHDWEYVAIGEIWKDLMQKFAHRPNTRLNLDQLAGRAAEAFQQIGLVIEVNTMPCLIFDPVAGRCGSPEIMVMGRIPGWEGADGFDHERKRWEVIASKTRGEDYLGQKEGRIIR